MRDGFEDEDEVGEEILTEDTGSSSFPGTPPASRSGAASYASAPSTMQSYFQ